MDEMIYVAMAGASQTLLAQAVNSNNLANVNTTGFRADLAQAYSLPVFGPGLDTRVYAITENPGVDFSPGSSQSTGRELDVAVGGEGFIAVQAPDGLEAYTRAGDLRISSNGLLETGSGHPVLGNAGPIAIPPAEKLQIGKDGTINVIALGQTGGASSEVDRIKLVAPPVGELEKGTDGLFRRTGGGTAAANANVTLIAGALESSNVNVVEAMVNMISLARQFEMQVKLMEVAERDDEVATQILQLT